MRFDLFAKYLEFLRRSFHLLVPQLLEGVIQPVGGCSFNLDGHIMPSVEVPSDVLMSWGCITNLGEIYPTHIAPEPCTIPANNHLEMHSANGMAQSVKNNL